MSQNPAALGGADNPLHIAFSGDSMSFGTVNAALAAADATVDLNGEDLTGVDDLTAATATVSALTAGRVTFAGAETGAPFPVAIVIFRPRVDGEVKNAAVDNRTSR